MSCAKYVRIHQTKAFIHLQPYLLQKQYYIELAVFVANKSPVVIMFSSILLESVKFIFYIPVNILILTVTFSTLCFNNPRSSVFFITM